MSEAEERRPLSTEKEMEAKHTGCHSRYKTRLHRPREHHDKCLAEHMENIPSQTQKPRSDSTDTCILESSRSDTGDAPDVPPLRRANSVSLTKDYLKRASRTSDGSEASISCVESNDDDYIPAEDSADEGSSEVPGPVKAPLLTKMTNRSKTKPRTSVDEEEKGTESDGSDDTGQDNVSVMKLKKKRNGARVYSKTHYCLYCPVHCHKMSRHLIQKHSREPAVAKAISFPSKSKERKMHFDLIRNQGNRAHNNEVLNSGSGTLVPGQQSAKPVKTSDYMHCINCEAFLKRKTLQRHMSTCRLSQKCSTTKPGKNHIQSPFAKPVPDGVTQKVLELVNAMHQDEIKSIVRKERSILKLAEHLYAKHGHDKTKREYIRQKMREVGRLIQQSQKRGLKCLKDFFVPSNFNLVIDAVKAVAGFDEEKNMFKTPSLALKLRHSLKKLADILECEAQMAESGNEEFLHNLNRTRGLFEKKWDVSVSSGAVQTLREGKWNTAQLLPLTEDVKIMHRHLEKCREDYQEQLKSNPNKKNWTGLATVTLAEVILFNGRREGEVSKMPLNAFTLRDTSRVHSDVALGLSKFEQKLCIHFQSIEIKGKGNRKVAILLTPDMLSSMEGLVAHRQTCGVPHDNPYFFARSEANTHLRGSDAIRQMTKESGAKCPETLSSTKLRKQVSTLSTVLNLKDNEMDTLANFLGHDMRDREYYRCPEGTVELAKVSKMLIASEQGRLSDFTGMSLDEIEIGPSEQVLEAVDNELSETERETSFCSSGSSNSKKRCQPESDSDNHLTGGPENYDGLGSVELATKAGSSGSKKRRQPESDSDNHQAGSSGTENQPPESDDDSQIEASKKRSWTQSEIRTVEKTPKPFRDCVMKSSLQSKGKKDKQSNTEDAEVGSDSRCDFCSTCGKKLWRGKTVCWSSSLQKVFCSLLCRNEYHPDTNVVTKKCYNCFQEITRPQKMILAPVDDSGTMKELCGSTCLASVKSRRDAAARPPPQEGPRSECRMCARYSYCKFNLKLDDIIYKLCSDTCVINYHKINNIPLTYCDVCGSFCLDPRNTRKMDGGRRSMCSGKCVAKFKEKAETQRLCLMCQTSHLVLDMIENINSEGTLELFCSNRCMMVHNAQTFTVSEKRSPSPEDVDIKEVKPSLLNLECIKEEPIDEDYCQILPTSVSNQDIKKEPNVAKEDLKIGSVFSLNGDSKPTKPTLTHMDLPASCSSCKNVLMDGETVYQRKGHQEIFCSSSCLLKFFQMKSVKKTCHFCLQVITQHQDVLQASVDNEGTEKDFCSQTCLSSFNYKSSVSSKIPVVPIASHSQCSMCSRYCISKKEIIQQGVVHKICSEPCFLRFCNMNKLSVCVNCRSCSSSPLTLKMEDGNKTLCGAECLVQFKQKIQTPQPCAMCHTSNPMSNMVEHRNRDNVVEFFCSCSCVMASKIQAVSASGASLNCDHCGKTSVPACHLAMSDSSIKNFCTLTCAMAFKESEKDLAAPTDPAGASKPPEKLLCAQCRRTIKTTPKVIQRKDKMNFVCSLACSQEFKKANNITGTCEYCKNVRIIKDTKRVEDKECNFCSDSCRVLLHHDLESKPGQRYCSCAYCLSIAVTVVTKHNEGTEVEFCSKECSKNYKNLQNNVAKCDSCGCKGKLKQSLPMVGEVKHFCDLKCLLHFCNNKVHTVDAASPASGSAVTTQSSPVIANVMSLASALSARNNTSTNSAQNVSVADIQTKVVGHASVQTVPKELKNKSMLCTPLVHNKGTSCVAETAETEAQTDKVDPEVVVLRVPVPVPVPVYVPLPMNMYTQYTPQPVGLPLPLPVPVFVPAMSDSSTKTTEETKQLESTDGDLNLRPETETEQTERNEKDNDQKDGDETKEGERQETQSIDDDNVDADDYQCTLDDQEDLLSGANHDSMGPSEISPTPPPAASPSQQTPGKVNNKNKKSKKSKEEMPQSEAPTVTTKKSHKVNTQHGIEAWKRWIQWRESQTGLGPISSHSVRLRADILRCSAVDLSHGLYRFIKEVKQPDGEPYSPDGLFYLCLGIQKHLLENGRGENIFTDAIYNKFSTKITKLLKHFQPSVASNGSISSSVREEFLWDCKQVGSFSPMVLLNTMLFFCCKYFGFTTVKEHRQLSFARTSCCTRTNPDKTKSTVLRFYPPTSQTEAETDADGVPAKKRKKDESEEHFLEMIENTENPLRCPVRLYEFYLSKTPDSVRQRSNLFYLQPRSCCYPSSRLWFTSSPLQDSAMEAMIVRIFAVQELQRSK
ncbi:zinc finger MYM-type protein 4-like isoform X3 [Amphiprion ocellaris]|uniref:zinc finger MYM-type protein 4-like isoform X3 n=1 Tax=Amphiprion ocellaris TaxID=80972 RepID=UPI0024115B8A|nr:zinc finger MYM-type protein 4-like isoform X3 [Amphiprion ocellaris]